MRFNIILIYFVLINVLSFLINCIDKYKAKHNKWRIKESTLWFFGLVGGATGGYFAMQLIRHKTKHKSFMIFMPILMIIQIAVLIYLYIFFNKTGAIV